MNVIRSDAIAEKKEKVVEIAKALDKVWNDHGCMGRLYGDLRVALNALKEAEQLDELHGTIVTSLQRMRTTMESNENGARSVIVDLEAAGYTIIKNDETETPRALHWPPGLERL